MIPAYWYMADKIEHLHDNWYRLQLVFFDQIDYGAHNISNGPQTGGMLLYTSLDIQFPSASVVEETIEQASLVKLQQNYPNPFNPDTIIGFSLFEKGDIELIIYNVKGQRVRTLLNQQKGAGEHFAAWDGKDDKGRSLPSGLYLYQLVTERQSITCKMMMLK